MNPRLNTFSRLAAAVALLASLAAAAAVKPNPYEKIAARNPFNLRTPDTNQNVTRPPPPRRPHPAVSITGLVDLRGVPRALVEVVEPGQPVKRSMLAAGGALGVLEVLHIDVAGERVRVRIDGDEEELGIQKPKPAAATALPVPMPPPRPWPAIAVRG